MIQNSPHRIVNLAKLFPVYWKRLKTNNKKQESFLLFIILLDTKLDQNLDTNLRKRKSTRLCTFITHLQSSQQFPSFLHLQISTSHPKQFLHRYLGKPKYVHDQPLSHLYEKVHDLS